MQKHSFATWEGLGRVVLPQSPTGTLGPCVELDQDLFYNNECEVINCYSRLTVTGLNVLRLVAGSYFARSTLSYCENSTLP